MGKPLDWAEQYSREYAGHVFLVLGPNNLAGLETPLTIGRSRRSDIRIDNDSVSKVHASIVFDRASGEYSVVDEHTRNGTCINGEALTPGVPAAVWSGAYVSFGDALFVFIDPPTLRKLAKLAM
jgi:pSer/pThr/pTyr-binding forkhead associated (FHA) protein